MARPLSRRVLARHIATQLHEGADVSALTQQLAAYLVAHKKKADASIIIRDIARQLADMGHVDAVVTVAHEPDTATKTALSETVTQATGADEVTLSVDVDASVIGGVKITTPGHELNVTIAHQLQMLKTRYRKA